MRGLFMTSIVLVLTLVMGWDLWARHQNNRVFLYDLTKRAWSYMKPHIIPDTVERGYGSWSIGIYTGPSLFELTDPEDVSNPVLTGKDVTDIEASFVADPFMAIEDGRYYMFFEVWNRSTSQGDIGFAESEDGKKWEYKNIIIDEAFHLSYPYVFKWDDIYYLMPESQNDLSIRLYKAVSFPEKWEYIGNLMQGYHWNDPSLVRYEEKWWLFVSTSPTSDHLNLYYSDELLGSWKSHPKNPIVKLNKRISRGAGRILVHDGRVYRFTQDGDPEYGRQVFAFAITQLSEMEYDEKIGSERPIVTMTGQGWNAKGMHTVDAHFNKGKWIAAVDGRWK